MESLNENDLAKCLYSVLTGLAHDHKRSYEEVSDHFVRLSGNLTALAAFYDQSLH